MNKVWNIIWNNMSITPQKMKFSIKDFFSKCDQARRKLRIWSHLLKKSLMENFIFCAVYPTKREIEIEQIHVKFILKKCKYYPWLAKSIKYKAVHLPLVISK